MKSAIPAKPPAIEKKIKGRIVIFNNLKNSVPIGLMISIPGPTRNPVAVPSTNAISIQPARLVFCMQVIQMKCLEKMKIHGVSP